MWRHRDLLQARHAEGGFVVGQVVGTIFPPTKMTVSLLKMESMAHLGSMAHLDPKQKLFTILSAMFVK